MIKDAGPVYQALLGTLMTWGLTAAGAGLVFFMQEAKVTDTVFLSLYSVLFIFTYNYLLPIFYIYFLSYLT